MSFDTIIRNGRWFDGTGAPSAVRNIGIRDGHITAVTPHTLDETNCPQVVDADGKPLKQGFRNVGGIKELASLVVSGKVAEGSNDANMLINATSLFVAK